MLILILLASFKIKKTTKIRSFKLRSLLKSIIIIKNLIQCINTTFIVIKTKLNKTHQINLNLEILICSLKSK